MMNMQNPTYPPPGPLSPTITCSKPSVAFTTPSNYAARLSHLLTLKGYNPLWCPTLLVHQTPHSLKPYLSPPNLESFSAVAFTSRAAISSLSTAANDFNEPFLSPHGETFVIAALGKDSELILDNDSFISKFCQNPNRIRVLVPPIATPSGLVESLGLGLGRRVLCPVPTVVGLDEPPVVPNFLGELERKGWVPVRVSAYETRWAGRECGREVVERCERGELGAVVFTSTAEVDGLLKSLKELCGWDWEMVRKTCPQLVVAAHGPVTAAGAESLGVKVDVVSSKFDSFDGVVDALGLRFGLV
jgi:uroporphyrinogen-III synthase